MTNMIKQLRRDYVGNQRVTDDRVMIEIFSLSFDDFATICRSMLAGMIMGQTFGGRSNRQGFCPAGCPRMHIFSSDIHLNPSSSQLTTSTIATQQSSCFLRKDSTQFGIATVRCCPLLV